MKTILLVLALGATQASEPPATFTAARERMLELARSTHAIRPEVLTALSAADHAALMSLARDPKAPLYVRARALGFAGLRRDARVEALWAEARGWPERELRIQAALSQAMAAGAGEPGVRFARGLLADGEDRVREVGINRLAVLGAKDVLRAHARVEADPVLRELIARRLAP